MRKIGECIRDKRLRFKDGLQKKFLEDVKIKSGLTWKELAEQMDISAYTLSHDWRNEHSTLPLKIAKKLTNKFQFGDIENIKKTLVKEILDKDWRQDYIANKIKKQIKIPSKSEDLAEIFGVILGDGHLERKTLTITGNISEIEHYNYLSKKIKMLFGLDSKIRKIIHRNTIHMHVNSVELIKFLLNNGFTLGDKIKNKESLPKWIFEKEKFIYGALRGLIDTDGGIYQKQKGYKRAIVEFQTLSPYIRKDLFMMIKKIGLNPSKSSVNVRIQGQEEIKKFMSKVGCSNPKNIIRWRHFINEGEIPLKEKLKNEILKLKVDSPFKAALV